MTQSLEELLDLSPLEPTKEETPDNHPVTREEVLAENITAINAISISEKVDSSLALVTGLDEHDSEMDDIASKALATYQDLLDLGLNVPDVHAGKIYEVAGSMLKTAMDARDAKVNKKLKIIELQLKKLRIDKMEQKSGAEESESSGAEFDRNELIQHMLSQAKSSK